MSEKDIELMERYIFEVTRRLPSKQREEISMDLKELIGDMFEEENATMESVIEQLGDPGEFAKKYRDENNYLISPEYFDDYIWIMKIVLIGVAISFVVSKIVAAVIGGLDMTFNILGSGDSLLSSAVWAFGVVTLIFAVMERRKVRVDLKKGKDWALDQLSAVPEKKGLISRGDSVFGLVFLGVFCILLFATPQLLGAYVFDEGELVRTIPVFNLNEWNLIFPVLFLGFFLCLIEEIIKLVTGCYCQMVMYSDIILGTCQAVVAIIVLKFLPLWNPDFANDVSTTFGREFTAKGDLMTYWGSGTFSNIILAIIICCTVGQIANTVYKTMRYGIERRPNGQFKEGFK